MGALFDVIRQNVTAQQVAELYGLPVNRYGKALCPWHNDNHPSLSFDKRTGRCKCFSCNAGGGAVDLAAVLLKVSPLEAAKRIDVDFHLNCEDAQDKHPPPIGASPVAKRMQELAADRKHFSELCDKERRLMQILERYTPEEAEKSAEFSNTLKALADVQLTLDNMM